MTRDMIIKAYNDIKSVLDTYFTSGTLDADSALQMIIDIVDEVEENAKK